MSRLPIPATVALLPMLLLVFSAPSAAGKPHKCTVDGKTVYQDHPCAGTEQLAPVAPPPAPVSAPPRAARSPTQVFDELQMVQRHERELGEAYKAEVALAEPRLAAMDAKARQQETKQLDARWLPRIRIQRQRVERLQVELRAQCPGGASQRGGRFECSR